MQNTRSLNRTEFVLATLYGIFSRKLLWQAMRTDVTAANDQELTKKLTDFTALHADAVDRIKQLIAIGKGPALERPTEAYLEESRKVGFDCARKAARLITQLRATRPRPVYNEKVQWLIFLLDKNEDNRW